MRNAVGAAICLGVSAFSLIVVDTLSTPFSVAEHFKLGGRMGGVFYKDFTLIGDGMPYIEFKNGDRISRGEITTDSGRKIDLDNYSRPVN